MVELSVRLVFECFHGGDRLRRGSKRRKLRAEVPGGLVKPLGITSIADDYSYAMAA